VTLVGSYDRSGRLLMANEAPLGTPGLVPSVRQTLSVRGTSSQGKLDIEVARDGGVWGTFKAVRTSSVSSAPISGEQIEYRDRFFTIYGPFEGSYQGRMRSVNGNDYAAEISLVFHEEPAPGGGLRPVLNAYYRRFDAPYEWPLSVDFNSQTGAIFMREDTSGKTSVPGGLIFSVSGSLTTIGKEKILDVKLRDRSRVLGVLKAVKK
jgi:hypothetical protein